MNNNEKYIPFEDGLIGEAQGFHRVEKCEYCGKAPVHANCHAHESWCPYYCKEPVSVPVGSEWTLLLLIPIYVIIKRLKRHGKD